MRAAGMYANIPASAKRDEFLTMATAVQRFRGDVNRARVVQLRLAGKTQDAIADELGFADGSAVRYHLAAWLAEKQPSAEQTEQLRQEMSERIECLHAAQWDEALAGDPKATELVLKLMDRKARLMGLDLERNVQVNILPTAEAMASAFGWAGDSEPEAIEGTAVDVTDA